MNDERPLILVVEDEPQIRRFVRGALEREGFRVCEASNAASGLAVITGSIKSMPDSWMPGTPSDPDKPDQDPPSVKYDKTRFIVEGKSYKTFVDTVNRTNAVVLATLLLHASCTFAWPSPSLSFAAPPAPQGFIAQLDGGYDRVASLTWLPDDAALYWIVERSCASDGANAAPLAVRCVEPAMVDYERAPGDNCSYRVRVSPY